MTNLNDTASAAQRYIAMGWAVVRLYDVSGGLCSCGSDDEPHHSLTQGGKHPIGTKWQNAGIRDVAVAREAWAQRPTANLGIVTGRASGIWVLDVDPEHGGDEKLAALLAAYGPLPETWVVQTGSGGRHYYWTMPDFDFTISRGRLPVGLDVRGNSGQVVAPPSYTLKGEYRILHPGQVVAAPGWLLSMIKPPERPEPGFEAPVPWSEGELTGRGSGYAQSAVSRLLAELAEAQPGTRNETAYRVGRRLAELVNSPWCGLDGEEVFVGFMAAARMCDIDGRFSATEAETTLRKAVAGQAGRGVPPPPMPPDMSGTPWKPPPIIDSGEVDDSSNGQVVSDFDQAGQDPAKVEDATGVAKESTEVAARPINGPIEQPKQVDFWEQAVQAEFSRMLVREEAMRRHRARSVVRTDFDQIALDDAGMAELPGVVELVADWLDMDCLARVNGPSGHGKSFVVLDIGACVSTGRAWHGHAVTQASVCYVVAEGARGTAKRAQAWCKRHDLDSTGITFIPRPVQIGGAEWETFKIWCIRRQFGLIIFDTQARNTVGSDENDATEMGLIVAGLDEIRSQTRACGMLVHHRGLRGDQGRGSTAVRGAMDIEIDVSRQGTTVTMKSTKQKDRADPAPLQFTMNELAESIVLIAETDAVSIGGPFTSPPAVPLSLRERCSIAIAQALLDAAGSGLTRTEAQAHARVSLGLGADESTRRIVRRGWSDLIGLGRIAKAVGREAHFFIEIDGAPILAANPDKAVQGGPEVYVA